MPTKFNPFTGTLDFIDQGGTQWLPPVQSEGDLPLTDPDGSVRVVRDTDTVYVFDSGTTQWYQDKALSGAFQAVSTAEGLSTNTVIDGDITRTEIRLHAADSTNPGGVSTGSQNFAGDKTFDNDVTITGDLTVNGTTTTVNSQTLDVVDSNITVNKNGNQASADLNDAGLTVEMSDATDAIIGYDSTLASKFRIGEVGSAVEIADVSSVQTFINKLIDADQNTITNIDNADIKVAAGIDAAKIADGSVSNTEYQYIGTLTSNAQDQLDNKQPLDSTLTALAAYNTNGLLTQTAPDTFVGRSLVDAGSGRITITNADGVAGNPTLDVNESNVNHDALANFVANEHIDHSSVEIQTVADSGLTGGGDITTSRSLSVDINGTTAETSADNADEILIHDNSAGALRKMTRQNLLGAATPEPGDLSEVSFSLANNQATFADVTGVAFANGVVRSAELQYSIVIDADSDLYETGNILAVQRGADWVVNHSALGDNSQVLFDINASGQLQYKSADYTGFVSGTLKVRATTTNV